MAFGDVNLDSCTLIGVREDDANIRHRNIINALTETSDLISGSEHIRRIPQSYFEKNTDYKFNLYWHPETEALLKKIETGAKRFAELFHSHEGIHSGNIRKKLFVDGKIDNTCRRMIFGRDEIRPFSLKWAGMYVRYNEDIIDKSKGEYANLSKEEYFTQPKIFVRRTGDYIMAAVDRDNFFASNNLFVCVPNEPIDLDFVAAVLNSNLMTWYFRAIQPRVGRLFAELKIIHLNEFPIKVSNHQYIDKLAQLARAASEIALGDAPDDALQSIKSDINSTVYQLYNLTPKEIRVIERTVG